MERVDEARLVAGRGIEGSADQGGRRQITIMDDGSWRAALRDLGEDVDPAVRRANLIVSGIDFKDSRGRLLRVGGCRIRVFGETRPCNLMDEAKPGLRDALRKDWRAGVFGEILEGGTIRRGDDVEWLDGQVPLTLGS